MQRKLLLFDLDHTLLATNCSLRFGAYLYSQRFFSTSMMSYLAWCYWRHKVMGMPMRKVHEKVFQSLFLGRSISEFEERATKFLDQHFDKMLYMPAVERLRAAQAAGHHTGILSSSPDFLIKIVAERFGVDTWRATRYCVDKDKILCTISHLMEGLEKAKATIEIANALGISRDAVEAYSDSFLDVPFLEAAGCAVGVNPDPKLRRLCKKNGWRIL
jgi:HAD superfamily hydrolase (TIGR01490 family)